MPTKIYVNRVQLPGIDKGTRFFQQDGMYYYKTRTEMDGWFSRADVEENCEVFEELDAHSISRPISQHFLQAI